MNAANGRGMCVASFGQVRTNFEQLEVVPKVLAPYLSLWMTAQEFRKNAQRWLNGPMAALDPEVLESEVSSRPNNRGTSISRHPSSHTPP